MKAGRSLHELATELERQALSKKDYLAPAQKLALKDTDSGIILQGVNGGMPLKATAHQQLASYLGIPAVYYKKMQAEAPDLLCANANKWLAKFEGQRKLIRTLDGQVRAILSDSYRPLDNYDLANAVLPKLIETGAMVESGQITDDRLYIKAVTERISGSVAVGDVIQAGALISNSEVGTGSLQIAYLDFRLICRNGAIRESAVRKAHLGRGARGQDAIEDAREYFRDETRALDDRAFFAKVQDATSAMFSQELFNKRLDQYRDAAKVPIAADKVPEVVEIISKKYGFNEGEKKSILAHLITGGQLTKFGLGNAITRAAQDVESYDRSTEMEAIGGQVFVLSAKDYSVS